MAKDRDPALYTIPSGVPFVDALAAGILSRLGDAPEDLARVTVLLPTRRACRSLREAFLRRRGEALLLPRLVPLGDLDEDELPLADGDDGGLTGGGGAPTAIPRLRRQLLLTRLVMAFEKRARTPEQAALLALELARLLDQVQTARLSFDSLAALVPEDFAGHWQTTLEFLNIVTENWPKILADEGSIDPAARRNHVLAAQAEAWRARPPAHPVIAAGSTGTIPATADLLSVVARLPKGSVVLPGLDRDADGETWDAIKREPTHPQHNMAVLLEHLGVEREKVNDWDGAGIEGSPLARAALITEALRPAQVTDAWRHGKPPADEALAGLSRIDCPGPQEEAGVIALVLREALETEGRTAALVTPDRGLARRVAAELLRWGIEIDDSAGRPLAETPPAAFLRMTARMVVDEFAPVPLLAALKHPLAAGGMATGQFRSRVRALEIAALRGPRAAAGIGGIRSALADNGAEHDALLAVLDEATRPFVEALRAKVPTFHRLLRAHVAMAEALAASDTETGPARLWAGDGGELLAEFVADLAEATDILPAVGAADYAVLLDVLMAGRVVRPRYGSHPRCHIWGLLEARLQHANVLVLGGLNEGTWPPEAAASPWMSRPMMEAFGLPLPERRVGLTAHDFAQAVAAPAVVLTRASRVEGTPTVPSRWLLRLENFLKGRGREDALAPDKPWIDWFAALDAPPPEGQRPVAPPAPKPPVDKRPRTLSVTRIETWIRDPYALYAERILGLEPLDPIDADPGAAERGTIVHKALERFQEAHPGPLPDDAFDKLIAIGEAVFEELLARPGVRAFWWPRFRRMARWYVNFERARRADGYETLAVEAKGRIEVPAPIAPFVLTARADRIDGRKGELAVIDYKTGLVPTWPQVKSGLVPQLPLEAAIAAAGGFEGVTGAAAVQLAYVSLSGGRELGQFKALEADVAATAEAALSGLARRIAAFDDAETPYLSRPRPMFESRYGTYDHLARVKEWLAVEIS